jgi:hypothetical protein
MIVLQAGGAAGFFSIIALIIILIIGIPLLGLQVRKILLKIFPVSNTKREFWIYVASILISIPLMILLLFILLLLFLLIL